MFFGYFKTPQNNWVIGEILNYYNLFDWRNDFHIFGHVIKEKWMTSWVACTLHICIVHHWHQQPITVYWLIILCLQLDGSCLAFNYRRSIHDWKRAMHSRFLLGKWPIKEASFQVWSANCIHIRWTAEWEWVVYNSQLIDSQKPQNTTKKQKVRFRFSARCWDFRFQMVMEIGLR